MPSSSNATRQRIEKSVKALGEGARATAERAQRRVRSLATDALFLGVGAPVYAMEKLGAAARGAVAAPRRRMQKVGKVTRQAKRVVKTSDARSYEERTRGELYELAQERDVAGRSGMSKKRLIAALRR